MLSDQSKNMMTPFTQHGNKQPKEPGSALSFGLGSEKSPTKVSAFQKTIRAQSITKKDAKESVTLLQEQGKINLDDVQEYK